MQFSWGKGLFDILGKNRLGLKNEVFCFSVFLSFPFFLFPVCLCGPARCRCSFSKDRVFYVLYGQILTHQPKKGATGLCCKV